MLGKHESQTLDTMVQRAREDIARGAPIVSLFEQSPEQCVHKRAGSDIVEMKLRRLACEKRLDDPKGDLRIAAMLLLGEHWRITSSAAAMIAKIAINDSVPEVRGVALIRLLRSLRFLADEMKRFMAAVYGRPKTAAATFLPKMDTSRNPARSPSIDELLRTFWTSMAGDLVADLTQDRAAALAHLADPRPNVRIACLSILTYYWRQIDVLPAICERMALTDSDDDVRTAAVSSLGTVFRDSDDSRVGQFLAKIVGDNSKTLSHREAAYASLIQVAGLPTKMSPTRRRMVGGFRFPQDVDWSFVNSFLPGAQADDE